MSRRKLLATLGVAGAGAALYGVTAGALNGQGQVGVSGTTYGTEGSSLLCCTDGAYNVKAYGAAGNGSKDDTESIQACIDAVPSTGGVVFFPPGTYIVSITNGDASNRIALLLRNNIFFLGAGTELSSIKLAAAQGDYKAIISHLPSVDVGSFRLENMTIDQNNANNQMTSHAGMMDSPFYSRYCVFLRYATASPTIIRDVHFTDLDNVNTISVINNVHSLKVSDCRFSIGDSPIDHDHSTVYHRSNDSHGLWVEGCLFTTSGSGTNSSWCAIETHGSAQFIRHNEVRHYQKGVNITGIGNNTGGGIVCESNSFLEVARGIGIWSAPYSGGIGTSPGLRNVIIRDNTIRIDTEGWANQFKAGYSVRGITLNTATLGTENVLIDSNWILFENGSYTGSMTYDTGADGIRWYRALSEQHPDRQITITNNYIENAIAAGITCYCTGELFNVSGNTIRNPGCGTLRAGGGLANIYGKGIAMTGVFRYSKMCNNMVLDTQTAKTLDIAYLLSPGADTGNMENVAFDNCAKGYQSSLVTGHATRDGWQFSAYGAGSFVTPVGKLGVRSEIFVSDGTLYRQTAAPSGSVWTSHAP